MRIRYTPEARDDLRMIKQYIAEELCNPRAAKAITEKILIACTRLKEQPRMGIALSERINRETDILYLIVGKHLVFYRVEETYISIVRILDSRTNYLQVLMKRERKL